MEFLRIPVSKSPSGINLGCSHEQSIFAVEFLKIYTFDELMNLSLLYNHKVVIYIYIYELVTLFNSAYNVTSLSRVITRSP